MKKLTLLLSLFVFIGAIATPVFAQEQKPQRSTTPFLQENHRQRHEMLKERAAKGDFDVMFVGDSITHNWDNPARQAIWDKKLGPKMKHFGISGDRTENIIWRVQNELFEGKSNPKLVVLMIGTNNTGHAPMDKPQDIGDGVKAIIGAIQEKRPNAKILILAIFPRGATTYDEKRVNNEAANSILKYLADGKKVFYADINSAFLTNDGTLEKTIMPDLLHPNDEGYVRWADAVLPIIKKTLAAK